MDRKGSNPVNSPGIAPPVSHRARPSSGACVARQAAAVQALGRGQLVDERARQAARQQDREVPLVLDQDVRGAQRRLDDARPVRRGRAGRGSSSRPRSGSAADGSTPAAAPARRGRGAAGRPTAASAAMRAEPTPWWGDATVTQVAASVEPAELHGVAGDDAAEAVADQVDAVGAGRVHERVGPLDARRRRWRGCRP